MPMIEATPAYRTLTSRTSLVGPDGLTSINTTPINQGALVLAAGVLYRLDRTSAAVVDGVTVIAPDEGPGRWLLASVGGSDLAVANLAALSALGVASPSLVWVNTLQCYWHRNPASTATIDGITVVATVDGVGRWERIIETSSAVWAGKAQWYVDVGGSDENDGLTAATPLATLDEFSRRVSSWMLRQNTTVTVGSNYALSSGDVSYLDINIGIRTLTIDGTETILVDGTIATFTQADYVTPESVLITSAEVPVWTAYAGTASKRLRKWGPSGAALGERWWCVADIGAGVGRFSRSAGTGTLAPGDTYYLESLPRLGGLDVKVRGAGTLLLSSLSLVNSTTGITFDGPSASLALEGCSVSGTMRSNAQSNAFNRGLLASAPVRTLYGNWAMNGALSIRAFAISSRSNWTLLNCSFFGSGTGPTVQTTGAGSIIGLAGCLFFDFNSTAIMLSAACSVHCTGLNAGARNAIALTVCSATTNDRSGGISFTWGGAANIPNIDATTTEVRVELAVDLNLTWATAANYSSDQQSGVATLVNGTVIVAARNSNTRLPVVTRVTAAGTARGMLEVPSATATASQFVINSVDVAGVLVDDDSTVSWFIPGFQTELHIGEAVSLSPPS